MKKRCYQPSQDSYPSYGGRGIKVADEWKDSFERFFSDMGDSWEPGLSLDRLDNDLGYCKENCRWATAVEQQRNKRNNVLVTLDGVTKTAAEWDCIKGYKANTVANRMLRSQLSEEEAVNKDPGSKKYTIGGDTLTVREWAEKANIPIYIVYVRLSKGMPMEQVIKTPIRKCKRLFVYKGEEKTLMEWCRALGLNYRTVNSRLTTMSWSVDKAFESENCNRR
jgi:hypothetical protein